MDIMITLNANGSKKTLTLMIGASILYGVSVRNMSCTLTNYSLAIDYRRL